MINNFKNIAKIVLTVSLLSTTSMTYAKNVALLIGVSDYKYLEKNDLDGPKNDVEALKNVLIKNWQFRPQDIHTLIDSQATQQGIINALNNLEQQTESGDEILIYLSGHGTSIFDEEGGSNSFKSGLSSNSGAFVPYEYDSQKILAALDKGDVLAAVKNNYITGQYHLKPVIQKLEKNRRITGIIDACFSEHSFRSIKIENIIPNRLLPFDKATPQKLSISSSLSTSEFNDNEYPYQNTVTIAASSKAQPALDLNIPFLNNNPNTTFDNKPHGLFSDLLIRILDGDIDAGGEDGIISYTDLENTMKSHIVNYPIGKEILQTPHFQPLLTNSNAHNLMNRPLFGLNRNVMRQRSSNDLLKIKIDNLDVFNQIVDNSLFVSQNSGLIDFVVTGQDNQWQLSAGNGTNILDKGNNQQLKNRIDTEYWLRSHIAKTPDITNLRVNALPEVAGNVFKKGENIQLAVSVDQPSALLAFNINSQGDISILYPINSTENQMIVANLPKIIPEKEKIPIQAPFGLDQIIFVALSSPLTNTELNEMSNLFSGSNSTMNTPEIKKLSSIIESKATAMRKLNIQTLPN